MSLNSVALPWVDLLKRAFDIPGFMKENDVETEYQVTVGEISESTVRNSYIDLTTTNTLNVMLSSKRESLCSHLRIL